MKRRNVQSCKLTGCPPDCRSQRKSTCPLTWTVFAQPRFDVCAFSPCEVSTSPCDIDVMCQTDRNGGWANFASHCCPSNIIPTTESDGDTFQRTRAHTHLVWRAKIDVLEVDDFHTTLLCWGWPTAAPANRQEFSGSAPRNLRLVT